MQTTIGRLARLFDPTSTPAGRGKTAAAGEPPIALRTPDGQVRVFGTGTPSATVVVNDRRGMRALASMDAFAVCEAYVSGSLDVEGDFQRVLALGSALSDRHPVAYLLRVVRPLLRGQVVADRATIPKHYELESDFWTLWLDRRHRCYSHGFFTRDDEPLEDAVSRKLDFALEAVNARPDDRILDIGGGWGAFTEHAGIRGIRVTSLTIAEPSRQFISKLISRARLDCEVLLEHFYEHQPAKPYDAIVNLGVTEHLPDYPRTMRHYDALLKPGGKVYLDASASRIHGGVSTFQERYIYRGTGMLLCLHEYLAAAAGSRFEPELVANDRHSYALTARHWARNLDCHREEIERRWGAAVYRVFRLFLWNTADSFEKNRTQAYHLILRRA